MIEHKHFDVIIIGGSYSGLAAGLALGRASKQVLIIDSGKPCNRQTPYSHNFLTQDGKTPAEIAIMGRKQLQMYATVHFFNGLATHGRKIDNGFEIEVSTGKTFGAKKLIFATGVTDVMAEIEGFSACWSISVLHCPYCHGYEVRNETTGILGNGENGYELAKLISNWTQELTLFTNGPSTLSAEQLEKLRKHQIPLVEKKFEKLEHINGHIQQLVFKDGTKASLKLVYARTTFEQHCQIPQTLGCELTEDGYIKVDPFGETTMPGLYACGDNVSRMRTVASTVAMGTTAGITASKKLIFEAF